MSEIKFPLISVIVPIYNVEQYLSRCVESLLNQTYSNLEILLIDDGSNDNSWKICCDFEKKFPYVRAYRKENGGQSSARNLGLDKAKGEYIGFIDSDDWVSHDMYEYLYSLIRDNNADLSQCNFMLSYSCEDKPKSDEYKIESIIGRNEILEYFMTTTTTTGSYSVCRCLIKNEIVKKYRFREGKINEDIDFKYNIFSDCNHIVVSDKICYFYFQSGNSTSSGKLRIKDFDLIDAAEELRRLTDKESYGNIKFLGQVKVARSAFSLLCKIAYFGISDEIENPKLLIKKLTKEHRSNVITLLKAPIPLSRKVLTLLLAIHINMVRWPLGLFKIKQ